MSHPPSSCLVHLVCRQGNIYVAKRRHRKKPVNLAVRYEIGHGRNRSSWTSDPAKKTLTVGRCTAVSCEVANDHTTTHRVIADDAEHDHEKGALRLAEHRGPATRIKRGDIGVRTGGRIQYLWCSIAAASFLCDSTPFRVVVLL